MLSTKIFDSIFRELLKYGILHLLRPTFLLPSLGNFEFQNFPENGVKNVVESFSTEICQ